MSIISALISTRDGTVASDGRRFNSNYLVNGVPTHPVTLAADDFDKTFSLGGGRIIGGFCGLLEFSGLTVAQHITQIFNGAFTSTATFLAIVDLIERQFCRFLDSVADGEVLRSCRNVDILLVGGAGLQRSDMTIATLRFTVPDSGATATRQVSTAGRANRFHLFGNDAACAAASAVFNGNNATNRDAKFLLNLQDSAIRQGVARCGPAPHTTIPSCGGTIFAKRTWY